MDRKSQNRLIQHGFTLLEVRGKTIMQRSSVNSEWKTRSHFLSVESANRGADLLVATYMKMIKL